METRKSSGTLSETEFAITIRAHALEIKRRRNDEARAVLGAILTGLLSPVQVNKESDPNWVMIRNHSRENIEKYIQQNLRASDLDVLSFAVQQTFEDTVRGAHNDPSLEPTLELVREMHLTVSTNEIVTEDFASTTLRAAGL